MAFQREIHAPNLVEDSVNLFPSSFHDAASDYLFEHISKVSRAISLIIPIIWCKLSDMVSSRSETIRLAEIIEGLRKQEMSRHADHYFDLRNGNWLNQGAKLSMRLFGSKYHEVVAYITSYTGLSANKAQSMLSTCLPAILGLISDKINDRQVKMQSLFHCIKEQEKYIMLVWPAGFNPSQIIGGIWSNQSVRVSDMYPVGLPEPPDPGKSRLVSLPFIIFVIVLLLLSLATVLFVLFNT